MRTPGAVRVDVLVVGAGPAGLAAAIELGTRGVRCLVVEQNERVGLAPRAKTTHARTREIMRRWGLADRLAQASPLGVDYPSNVVFATRLAGFELARFENAFNCSPEIDDRYAEHAQWVPQYVLEEVLREHAASLPDVELRFLHEFLSYETLNDGSIRAFVRELETGVPIEVRAEYLIGADGARSRIRELIGATMSGQTRLSRNYNLVFRAPGLAQAHRLGPAIMYWLVNPDLPGLMGPMDSDDRWFFMPMNVRPEVAIDPASAPAMIRLATGIDGPFEILSSDEWAAASLIADTYRAGRVLLVGDACHLHPPMGGYGMNMGIADAVDVGWKVAACLQGWGGERLLESYALERRPVHEAVIAEAVANHAVLGAQLWRDGLEDDTAEGAAVRAALGTEILRAKRREFHAPGVVKGYVYRSPVIVAENDTAPGLDWRHYEPQAAAGGIAPHGWLEPGRSLYDAFGAGFTLLSFECGCAEAVADSRTQTQTACRQLLDAASASGIPVLHLPLTDPGLAARYGRRLVLVRPDQHVAWCGNALEQPAQQLWATVTGR